MAMTKRELIQFMDELVELASEENKTRAILVKENSLVILRKVTSMKRRFRQRFPICRHII